MKLYEILSERYLNSVYRGRQEIAVFKNPSRKEIADIRADSLDPNGVVRGFIFDNGDVAAWDGYAATHSEMEAEMFISGIPIFLHPTHVELRRISEGDPALVDQEIMTIKNNPIVKHLYTGAFEVIPTFDQ